MQDARRMNVDAQQDSIVTRHLSVLHSHYHLVYQLQSVHRIALTRFSANYLHDTELLMNFM